jgi:nucleoside-diphosphate-sugar epimerase
MKALILGCGYLGRRGAARWLDAGYEVAALTRSAVKADELRAAGIRPVLGDVTDAASLAGLPAVDVVLYAVGYDRSSGRDRRQVVVEGPRNALAALAGKAGRFVFVSTTSVYGQSSGEWVDEQSPTEPATEAGRLAVEAEEIVSGVLREGLWPRERPSPSAPLPRERGDGMERVILRLSGLYGPGRLLRRVEQLRAGEPIAGDGEAWLNLIHVEDAAEAVVRAAEVRLGDSHGSWGASGSRVTAPPPAGGEARTGARREGSRGEPLTPGPSPQGEGGERGGSRWERSGDAVGGGSESHRESDRGPVFLVSDDRPVRRREYYGRLADLTGSPAPVFDPALEGRSAGLGKRCRNGRAKRELGLRLASPTFEEGLRQAVRQP